MKNPKIILITGASSGIGHELAQLYAAPGITLLLTGRDKAKLADIESLCAKKGATVKTSAIAVTDRAGIEKELVGWDEAHPIDLVIANAGISGGHGLTGVEAEDTLRNIMATNVDGMFNTVNPLIDRMRARKSGQIALMSSIAGFRGLPSAAAYSVSKNAVRAYGEALRPLLKKDGVEVNIICPGFIRTPLTDKNKFSMPFLMPVEKAARIIYKGLAANRAVIAFPWQMRCIILAITALPRCCGDAILANALKKNS